MPTKIEISKLSKEQLIKIIQFWEIIENKTILEIIEDNKNNTVETLIKANSIMNEIKDNQYEIKINTKTCTIYKYKNKTLIYFKSDPSNDEIFIQEIKKKGKELLLNAENKNILFDSNEDILEQINKIFQKTNHKDVKIKIIHAELL